MRYQPSPRPVFSKPTHIPFSSVTRHLWGDDVSGRVADAIYVSSERIHQLVFELPPGGAFRHSDAFRTVFAADEVFYVLSGEMILANPETGEVHPVRPGEAAFFRRDTWHHAFNYSAEPLRVLEYFAPPPAKGTSGTYAQTKANLLSASYTQDRWLGQWPMKRDEARRGWTMHILREADRLWRLEGEKGVLVGLLVSTEHLTVGQMRLLPGQHSDPEIHGGDECLYLLDGTLNVYVPEQDGQCWFELQPRDGFYIPQGVPHQYYNMSGAATHLIFGVAPRYHLAPDAAPSPQ